MSGFLTRQVEKVRADKTENAFFIITYTQNSISIKRLTQGHYNK